LWPQLIQQVPTGCRAPIPFGSLDWLSFFHRIGGSRFFSVRHEANLGSAQAGRVKILDLGLAKLTHAQGTSSNSALTGGDETEPGLVMGTADADPDIPLLKQAQDEYARLN
jgi:hypothetical protein